MTRMTLFDSPLFLGFDQLERTLDRVAKSSNEGYPPYNIEQLSQDRLRISLAVAGFAEEDLSIHREGNQLVVMSKKSDKDDDRIFLHRGIASRQFKKSFLLAEGIDIEGAYMESGLLHIELRQPLPEQQIQKIEIKKPSKSANTKAVGKTTVAVDLEEE
ncbi:MAG: Hsp20 family protein [Alphaproteobacteria bacterium]|nr:Hsp20 family protein [Alphaproteobacteria bacterium]